MDINIWVIPILIHGYLYIRIQKDNNTDTKSLVYFSLGPQTYFQGPIRHTIQDAKIIKDTEN